VSASWLACTFTLDRWVPKWTPFFTLFLAASCAVASSRPCGSDIQILKAWKPADQLHMLFPLLLPPPSFLFEQPPSPPWRNEMSPLRSWKLEPNPTAIGEEPAERKTALETTESTTIRLRRIRAWCWIVMSFWRSVSLGLCELRY